MKSHTTIVGNHESQSLKTILAKPQYFWPTDFFKSSNIDRLRVCRKMLCWDIRLFDSFYHNSQKKQPFVYWETAILCYDWFLGSTNPTNAWLMRLSSYELLTFVLFSYQTVPTAEFTLKPSISHLLAIVSLWQFRLLSFHIFVSYFHCVAWSHLSCYHGKVKH